MGISKNIEEEFKLEKTFKHTIEIVIDRVIIKPGAESRLAESVETALAHGEGLVIAMKQDGNEMVFNTKLACLNTV